MAIVTRLLLAAVAVGAALSAEDDDGPNGLNVTDFRRVGRSQLQVEEFVDGAGGAAEFSEILFDVDRYQVIVGARDALFRLGLEGLTMLEKATWEAKASSRELCVSKGQSEVDCRNYVKVRSLRTLEDFKFHKVFKL